MSTGQNHYAVLGVAPDAQVATIKRAYYKLSMRYHPDKQARRGSRRSRGSESLNLVSSASASGEVGGASDHVEGASDRFASIALAYEVLSDPEKRKLYDMYGDQMAKRAAFEMNELTGVIPIYFTTGATGVFVGIIALLSWGSILGALFAAVIAGAGLFLGLFQVGDESSSEDTRAQQLTAVWQGALLGLVIGVTFAYVVRMALSIAISMVLA